MPVKIQIEHVITEVYRQRVGELEFTDRKYENCSLQIERRRPGVYRQRVGELEFTDRKIGDLEQGRSEGLAQGQSPG